ncbi:MAG TPA: hypothetical protein VGQ72_05290 [Pyrinomonadaceae bacterium]|jgi:hypothetical protein|nr:hypothetical protein [Pyrinomonadaceae bacterium]
MKVLMLGLLIAVTPVVVQAAPLKVVNVGAPAINCVFTTASPCTITVSDTVSDVLMSAGGTGRLQSRTFKGLPGSAADGLFAYEYRLDLTNAVGTVNIACVDWMTISFGPVVSLDYNADQKVDQVFVVTSGGLGTIGLASAVQTASTIKFTFSKPVCEGGAPGKGDTSFFWGLVSKTTPKNVTAMLHETGGATHVVKARSPM